jgi:hypothetical protein
MGLELTAAMGIQNFTNFRRTEIGIEMKPSQMMRLKAEENWRMALSFFLVRKPSVWKIEATP